MPTKEENIAPRPTARVAVRMYRQGLGDCFLLTFPAKGGKPFRMLIDCGVVLGTEGAADEMKKVVAQIADETKGHLDVLIATHEHWDHVSGFSQAKELFDRIQVDQVWLAWTEDPSDPLAKKLAGERRAAENALRMAVTHLGLAGDSDTAARVDSLVGFFGAAAGSTETAMNYVKTKGARKPRYCRPGEDPIELPDLPNVRFWVLGPPHDEKLIKKSDPGKGEAYGLDAGQGGSQAFFIAGLKNGMAAAGTDDMSGDVLQNPFDDMYSIPMARAEQLPFFEQRYFGDSTDRSLYEKRAGAKASREIRDQSWRRIDAAWMGLSETMALQLDSATNNTSLALAIELVDTGEVLLFPGDAQAGSWLSWQDLKWEADKDSKRKGTSGPDLLARTVFYKVGHHGSHNATLRDKGLELMINDDLVAMIPVNHDMAVKKRWGKMPLPELVDRINEKTHGRVLRIDDKAQTPEDLEKQKPSAATAEEWRRFTDRVTVTNDYYEIEF